MRENPLGDDLARAHRAAAERLAAETAAARQRAEAAMSATPGWFAAAKAAAAQSVLEATMAACDARVAELLEVHIDRGERNAEAVAKDLREHLLKKLSAPGLGFFEDSSPESATLMPTALRHAAEFESWRDRLATGLAARYRQALEARERRIPLLEMPGAWQRVRESKITFAILLVTMALSVCGVSWAGIVRNVFGLL